MKSSLISFLFLAIASCILAQSYTISGHIVDSNSGETLIGSSVFDAKSMKGTASNNYGFYSLTLAKGDVDIHFSYVGYVPIHNSFNLNKDTVINVSLTEYNILKEVTIIGQRTELGVKGSQMSAIDVPIALIKKVPTLFGETDLIKALQLLPGVQGGTEGSAGFYVRGGGPDENLFLLDGVPVYNVNHLGGLFSVFNPDAIKNVTLYKGSFPARFGGRLSSVLDIRMNDGNNKKLHGNVSVGVISSKFNLEGPLFSEKTSFNIAARRTYYDLLLQPMLALVAATEDIDRISAGYYFYDLNAKISHKFSDKDRLYLSTYMGDDVVYANIRNSYKDNAEYSSEGRMKVNWNWGNLITALRWNHVISNKLFMNTTAAFTRYRFDMAIGNTMEHSTKNPKSYEKEEITLGYKSGIVDYSLKFDFDYNPNPNHDIKFGATYVNHSFRPGVQVLKVGYKSDTLTQRNDTTFGNRNIQAHETSAYIEDNYSLGSYVKANLGLHYSTFTVQSKFYHSLQPRLSVRALLSDKLSFKAGYAAMNQYIHLLSNSNISLPTDLWVPVTERIKPMTSHQYSAGIFYNLKNIGDVSVEGYYKSMNNLIEYKDGASFMGSSTGWEDKVSMGEGWAYGLEFLLQKSVGNTTGWLGYTWAKSERLFDRPGQELNNGNIFPAKYDRRHDLSLVLAHTFSEKFDMAGTVVYSTGNSATLALQDYAGQPLPDAYDYNSSLPYISQRNNFRLPDYFRVDLGMNFHKEKKHGKRTWNVGVYNLTNSKNPFLIFPTTDYEYNRFTGEETAQKKLKKITIFTLIPSISYSYKF